MRKTLALSDMELNDLRDLLLEIAENKQDWLDDIGQDEPFADATERDGIRHHLIQSIGRARLLAALAFDAIHQCDECGAGVPEDEAHGHLRPDGTWEHLCPDCPTKHPGGEQ